MKKKKITLFLRLRIISEFYQKEKKNFYLSNRNHIERKKKIERYKNKYYVGCIAMEQGVIFV